MKLATYQVSTPFGPVERLGMLVGEAMGETMLLDVNAAYAWLLHTGGEAQPQRLADVIAPAHMRSFIEMGPRAKEAARLVAQAFLPPATPPTHVGMRQERLFWALAEVTLLSPLPDAPSLRDFLAFEQHTKAGFDRRGEPIPDAWYRLPVYYKGNPKTLIGHKATVPWPHYTQKLDYELEWACIIGKAGQDISQDEADNYIFGYTILNDFSARDIQADEMKCRLGPAKGKDFASALGPWIVLAESLPDSHNLTMQAHINGECWSEGNTGTSHWSWAQMIAHVSMAEMLYPGDILGSGTVGRGCGLELDRWLQPGDEVSLTLEGIGTLTNRIGERG
jgi:2-keto-4-pentenoate hydratase/2-oxohepta-3-ene-1,7-dioic acid hydratase in catechol pathway